MNRALALAERLCSDIAQHGVRLDPRATLDRSDAIALQKPGLWSANGHGRMVEAADGWMAVNLARVADRELVPAWLGRAVPGDPWRAVIAAVRSMPVARARERAALLGMPVAVVGEASPRLPLASAQADGGQGDSGPRRRLRVVDLSALWAGPLCAAILGAAGGEVVKVESAGRPDTTARSAPALDARLNGAKQRIRIDFTTPDGRARLAETVADGDVLVTSARARAFAALGLEREALFAANPGLIWVAISGYGWDSGRVAFGDDAAAAGGLVRWTAGGTPRFVGDAIADPLTGLAAAAAALAAIDRPGGAFIDAAMARVAAAA